MRKGLVRSVQIGLTSAAMLLASATMASAASTVEADASRSGDSGGVSILANTCGYRTSAYPNSYWVLSLAPSLCAQCPTHAANYEASNPGKDFYCTYNPSNDKVDLHWRYI
ncbi:hypothetical protein GA0070618_3684 [Micromonospora echinospora]|uniref:Uncharacterized protein n=1 Tax=Micromonospora echinospora TaxID=1877 RepID=A0A1C4Y8E5_MICEC|nr:hypothetical protein [Micromonospora echinospora]SCF16992.1 hypothetical protein GA0070618_3684 [Micromonospora echinospora]